MPRDALYILAEEPGKELFAVAVCGWGLPTVPEFADRWTRMAAPPNLPTVTSGPFETRGRRGGLTFQDQAPSDLGVKPHQAAGQLSPEPDS